MFANLMAEMARKRITTADLSTLLGLSNKTVRYRLAGKSEWELNELEKIRDTYFSNMTLEYLFERRRGA